MKIIIDRDVLLGALQTVSGAIERRQTLAVLSNILLEAENDFVRLSATDLEVELSVTLKASSTVKVLETGAITVSGKKWLDVVKTLPAGEIELSFDASKFIVRSGRSRFTLTTLPAVDFPHLEEGIGTIEFSIDAPLLADLIEKTQFAMAVQDVRYFLNGLLLESEEQCLRAVATDGHRLALAEQTLPQSVGDFSVIIPRKGVLELGRIVGHVNDKVKVVVGSNHIRLTAGETKFTSKLIDSKFPNYKQVLPKTHECHVSVDKEAFREALQRTAIVSSDKYKGVRIVAQEEGLLLYARSSEHDEAEVVVAAEVSRPGVEIGFNVQYLLDITNVVEGESLEVLLGDVNSSVLIKEKGVDNRLYVVMPMRL